MLQSVSVDGMSPPPTPRPGSPRPDNRHSAQAKRQKYFRRLFKVSQMDFEFAIWQMIYLMSAPQKVYRNFQYRKQTKNQWARDDPAFLVLLSICLCVSSAGFAVVRHLGFYGFFMFLLRTIFLDCIGSGILIATALWFVANNYLQGSVASPQDVEWGFAFDIHLNAFFPVLILLHVVQLLLYIPIQSGSFYAVLLANSLWLIAAGYYIYITFLGYSALPFLKRTIVLLYPPSITVLIIYVILLISRINLSQIFML
ncbi:protein unc-50 homolog B-like isoform X2 [Apostichopus japonicus]